MALIVNRYGSFGRIVAPSDPFSANSNSVKVVRMSSIAQGVRRLHHHGKIAKAVTAELDRPGCTVGPLRTAFLLSLKE
jgi:hypothetical protein